MIAAEVTVKINHNAARTLLTQLSRGMAVAANDLRDRILESLSIPNQQGMYPAHPGEPPHRGNGDLMRSIMVHKVDDWTYHIGSFGVPYGALQEVGGFVSAKNKSLLTIPMSKQAVAHRTKKRTAMEFPKKLRFRPGGPNVAYLVDEKDAIHYILKKTVYIPAHPYLRPAVSDPEWHRRAMHFMGEPAEGLEAVSAVASTVG